jgi:hypothetical protein
MTRSSLLCGLLGLVSVGLIAASPLACSSGGVGDPCTPEDEYSPQFPGFQRTLENIESRSFQCETRICLVNHFQGRVSCPLGQPPVDGTNAAYPDRRCTSPNGQADESKCTGQEKCTQTQPIATDCDPTQNNGKCDDGTVCDPAGKFCQCDNAPPSSTPNGYACDTTTHQFQGYICHVPGNCQTADGDETSNCDGGQPKDCCVPGTDKPIAQPVCSQCTSDSNRDAAQAVYCSCRCDASDTDPNGRDPNFNYCDCPSGYECSEIRPDVGLGDPQITGKYCIKNGTAYDATQDTGCTVDGYFDSSNCPHTTQATSNVCNNGGT